MADKVKVTAVSALAEGLAMLFFISGANSVQ